MNENVVFLAVTENFPVKFSANNSKNELIAKALSNIGCNIFIVNGLNGFTMEYGRKCGKRGRIKYFIFKKGRGFQLIRNALHTYFILKKIRNKESKNYLLIGYNYFPVFLFYVILAKLLGYKTSVLITEWHIYFEKKSLFRRFNYFLFDCLFGYFIDCIFPISNNIVNKVKRFKKPILKIPILADYDSIKPKQFISGNSGQEYFLYCGDIAYWNIIEFTIHSYKSFIEKGFQQKLHLIINGTQSDLERVRRLIETNDLRDSVIVKTRLPFKQLIDAYQGALALLIPLRTEKADTARFPHKIGEYIATGRPIITGNVGEVGIYFNHTNAYIAEDFSINTYADLMEQVANSRDLANDIGLNGRKTGESHFHYLQYGIKIMNFLNTL